MKMYLKINIGCLLLLVISISTSAAQLPPKFLKAIQQVESGGRKGLIIGDNGRARGPFQIHREYWKDSGVGGQYTQCENYDYSVKVVTAYLNKYAPRAVKTGDFKTLARVHNGGPRGASKPETLAYWERVRKHL